MKKNLYQIKNQRLKIMDRDLDIFIDVPFDIPLLKDFPEKYVFRKVDKTTVETYLEKNGQRHGECMFFTPTKKRKARCFYFENKLHGPSKFYSEKKILLCETWYVFGKKQGKSTQYYENKNVYSLQRFKNHLMEGIQEYYYANGQIKSLIEYKNNLLDGETTLFWENGKIKRKAFFLQGKRHGWDRIFNEKGQLVLEGKYAYSEAIEEHKSKNVLEEKIPSSADIKK